MADLSAIIPPRNAPAVARQVLNPLAAQEQHFKFANGIERARLTVTQDTQTINVSSTAIIRGLVSDAYELLSFQVTQTAQDTPSSRINELQFWWDDPASADIKTQIYLRSAFLGGVVTLPATEVIGQATLSEIYWVNTTSVGRSASRPQDALDRGSVWVKWTPTTGLSDFTLDLYLRPLSNNGRKTATAVL